MIGYIMVSVIVNVLKICKFLLIDFLLFDIILSFLEKICIFFNEEGYFFKKNKSKSWKYWKGVKYLLFKVIINCLFCVSVMYV